MPRQAVAGLGMTWDPVKYSFPNMPEADQFLHCVYREGWAL